MYFPKLMEALIVYKYFKPGIPYDPVWNGRSGTPVFQIWIEHPARQSFNGRLVEITNPQSKAGTYSCKTLPPGDAFIAWQDKLEYSSAHKGQRVFLYGDQQTLMQNVQASEGRRPVFSASAIMKPSKSVRRARNEPRRTSGGSRRKANE